MKPRKNKKILIASILGAVLLIIIIIAYIGYQTVACGGCLDGRGDNYYFPRSALQEYSIGEREMPKFVEDSKIAESHQSCACFTYKIKENGSWRAVGKEEFSNFLEKRKGDLLVYLTGWPYWGTIINYSGQDASVCEKIVGEDANAVERMKADCLRRNSQT